MEYNSNINFLFLNIKQVTFQVNYLMQINLNLNKEHSIPRPVKIMN